MDSLNVVARRNNPDYMQIAGDVRKKLGLRFKAACMLKQLTLGEGLEQAISEWLEKYDKSQGGNVERVSKEN
ncbi:MAG: hypothetical protein HC908_16210 [Calothrix sp. SM1_7_51]|nr:hypothetical protein [Calothrix sp. SM1_7_51]